MAKTTKKAPAKAAKKAVKKTAAKSTKTVKKAASGSASKKSPVKTVKKAVKKAPAKKAVVPKGSLGTKKVPAPKKSSAPKKIAEVKNETQKLADAVVDGILELKGKNITVMDLRSIHNRVCDYFIICQAESNTQVNAIADSIQETVRKTTGDKPYRSEGFENSEWILIDYVTVVVHIFQSHIRDFYNLESLWADAETIQIAFD
jgi:ribosome-associated protein